VTENPQEGSKPDEAGMRDIVEEVLSFCRFLIGRLELQLSVEATLEGETLCIDFSGPDRPVLLSNSAAVLNSMEYLANRVFHTEKDGRIASVVFDSCKYRKHREAELVLLAQMASKKVLAQQKPLNLQPMTPRERRIVHLALTEIEGVRSQSEGDGDNRSITIYPV
jgi:spoIIIJ-associated protein